MKGDQVYGAATKEHAMNLVTLWTIDGNGRGSWSAASALCKTRGAQDNLQHVSFSTIRITQYHHHWVQRILRMILLFWF